MIDGKHENNFKFLFADLASGSSIDWVYGTQNVSLTYTFEFRDKGDCIPYLLAMKIVINFQISSYRTLWFLASRRPNHSKCIGSHRWNRCDDQRSQNTQLFIVN